VHRELPFTIRLPLAEAMGLERAEVEALNPTARTRRVKGLHHRTKQSDQPELFHQLDGEFVIITGVADLVVLRPEEIWIVDFKTDAVEPADWEKKAQRYQPQMTLYALALSRIFSRPVTRCWLHSLPARRTLPCARAVNDS
jgi:ATP-dependent exoDNAse (exonuclease V) beta subunit